MGCKLLLLLLGILASTAQVHSIHLTKEIILVPTEPSENVPSALLQHALGGILQPAHNIATNLAELLVKNSKPQVNDVLDVFNSGIGSPLLVIVDDNIQLDADGFEQSLFNSARKLSQALYPNDYFQQLLAYRMFQQEIKKLDPSVKIAFSSAKIPVQQIEELLSKQGHYLSKRDTLSAIQQRDVLSDLYNAIISQIEQVICQNIVNTISSMINGTLSEWIYNLEQLDVTTDGDIISSVLAGGIELVIFFIEQGLNCSNQWFADEAESVCVNLITVLTNSTTEDSTNSTSRRRRDVAPAVSNRIIFELFEALWGIGWGLLSVVINPILKLAAATGTSLLLTALNSAIDNIFPSIFS